MANTAEHLAARNDNDLLQRFIAVAEQKGVPNAQAWAESNRGRLVAVDIDGTSVATVHAYAVATYTPTPRPGVNPAGVTDTHLAAAVDALFEPITP